MSSLVADELKQSSCFDDNALSIAKRQYFQESDENIASMFRRVARWVASPETDENKSAYEELFFELMLNKRFCPGGRVLAGADTSHGNVLNCFVQDGSPKEEATNAWVMQLATKLALVTKVGGGNGLCLDPIKPKRTFMGKCGQLYLTISPSHPDYAKVQTGTYMDLVRGKYVTKGYRFATFVEHDDVLHLPKARPVGDSVENIWHTAKEVVYKLLDGQDILLDITALRSEGTPVKGSGGNSSGPSSFAVEVFDNFGYWASLGGAEYAGPIATLRYIFAPTLRVIRQGGTRRGAGMATMSITNSDIKDFINCKDLDREQSEGDISTFNISVLATDAFMSASKDKKEGVLYDIAEHAHATGEPGVIFIDRINENNAMLNTLGAIKSTNPCGEIPLYAGEPCDLGAMNLAAYVKNKEFDFGSFNKDVKTAIRFLDNVLVVNKFALEDNHEMSMRLRRLGLGVMGLADALIKTGKRYDSEQGRKLVTAMITALRDSAHEASKELAEERGVFPDFEKSDIKDKRRNVAVLTTAPTGTTSMVMGVSSGIEPIFSPFIFRKVGSDYMSMVSPLFKELVEEYSPHPDYALEGKWDWDKIVEVIQNNHGSVQGLDFVPEPVKAVFVCAHDISPEDHVRMQGAVQRAFDDDGNKLSNSISKTINMPNEATVEDVYSAYNLAFKEKCKGITVYRDGSRDLQVLNTSKDTSSTNESTKYKENAPSQERLPSEPLFDRPMRLSGFTDTVKLTLPNGDKRGFYVTVNKQDNLPTEVFIQSGKAGDEANADSEALGRVVSIALQYGVPAEAIIKTLRGINGGMYGTYQGRMVASKADLIAVALETTGVQNVLNQMVSCPECGGTLRFEEGCQKCGVCGYSKCG